MYLLYTTCSHIGQLLGGFCFLSLLDSMFTFAALLSMNSKINSLCVYLGGGATNYKSNTDRMRKEAE